MVKVKRKRWLPQKFFKVFMPNSSSHYMKFPPAFLKHISRNAPFRSTIISPAKISWNVRVEKVCDNLYFEEGWEQFVQHNSLELGDFLVFSYDGNSIFRVRIYGQNGCEKESTYRPLESHRVLAFLDEEPIDETSEYERPDSETISNKFEKGYRDFKEASDFVSDFPFFKVVMRPSYITNSYMMIPNYFSKRHMDERCTRITLLFRDKSWPVNLMRYKANICRFSCGWTKFVRDNALKEGDACVFELVSETDHVFNVTIFRCSD